MGFSPWGHKELDMTERLTLSFLIIDSPAEISLYFFFFFLNQFGFAT